MSDHHNGFSFAVYFREEIDYLPAGFRIQVAGGLVGQDNGRIVGEHSSQSDPLLLADAQFAGLVIEPIAQADAIRAERSPVLRWALDSRPERYMGTSTFSTAVRYGTRLKV